MCSSLVRIWKTGGSDVFTRDVIGFNLLSSISLMLELYYTVDFNHISISRACASVFNSNVDTDLLYLMKLH